MKRTCIVLLLLMNIGCNYKQPDILASVNSDYHNGHYQQVISAVQQHLQTQRYSPNVEAELYVLMANSHQQLGDEKIAQELLLYVKKVFPKSAVADRITTTSHNVIE